MDGLYLYCQNKSCPEKPYVGGGDCVCCGWVNTYLGNSHEKNNSNFDSEDIQNELADYNGKISGLISKLQKIQDIKGDVDVYFDGRYSGVSLVIGED